MWQDTVYVMDGLEIVQQSNLHCGSKYPHLKFHSPRSWLLTTMHTIVFPTQTMS